MIYAVSAKLCTPLGQKKITAFKKNLLFGVSDVHISSLKCLHLLFCFVFFLNVTKIILSNPLYGLPTDTGTWQNDFSVYRFVDFALCLKYALYF